MLLEPVVGMEGEVLPVCSPVHTHSVRKPCQPRSKGNPEASSGYPCPSAVSRIYGQDKGESVD